MRSRLPILILLIALPALAAPEQPFEPGDVVVTAVNVECGPHFSCSGSAAFLHHPGSQSPVYFPPANFRYPTLNGVITYSPALNRMILAGEALDGMAVLETLDGDGRTAQLLALEQGRITALAGIGDEILAVILVKSLYRHELWRISARTATVTERIELPFPNYPGFIRSIDLAGDRCTLAYAVRTEPVHRYDICARRPLEDATAGRSATAVHFVPGGNLLVLESDPAGSPAWPPRLALYDRGGRLLSKVDFHGVYYELSGAIAVDADGSSAWVTGGLGSGFQSVNEAKVELSDGALVVHAGPLTGAGVAVAGEWRAAEQQPQGRRRVIRH